MKSNFFRTVAKFFV